jgi:hypothetical protein
MSPTVSRRDLLCGGVAGAAFAMSQFPWSAFGFAGLEPGEELVPFVDPPPVVPGHVAWNQ